MKIGDTNEDFGSSYTMALSEEELIKGNHFTTYIVRNSKSKDVLAHEMGHVYDNISNPKAYYNESVKNKNKPIGLRHNCLERNQYFNNILGNHSLRFHNHYNTGKW